jgi:hypothetical protein
MRTRALVARAALTASAALLAACGGSPKAAVAPTTTASPPSTSISTTAGTAGAAAPTPSTTAAPAASSTTTADPTTTAAPPADQWPAYHGGPLHQGDDTSAPPASKPGVSWRSPTLDGSIYGEPLVVNGEVVVATLNNTVYALNQGTGAIRWSRHLAAPVNAATLLCGDVGPAGIISTPVADPTTNQLWVVSFDAPSAGQAEQHDLVDLNLSTGAVLSRRDVDPPGSQPALEQQRGALALDGDRVLIAYGGLYGDCGGYHGYVVSAPQTGTGPDTSWMVPTEREAGIWAPSGVDVLSDGSFLFTTGNGASRSVYDDANAVVHMAPALHQEAFFAPANWATLSADDLDLGSSAPAVLPGNLAVQVGKQGVGYLLNVGRLGGVGGQLAQTTMCPGSGAFGTDAVAGSTVYVPCRSGIVAAQVSAPNHLRVLWRNGLSSPGSPVVAGGRLWELDRGGQLISINPANGGMISETAVGSVATSFPSLSAVGATLYAATTNRVVAVHGA